MTFGSRVGKRVNVVNLPACIVYKLEILSPEPLASLSPVEVPSSPVLPWYEWSPEALEPWSPGALEEAVNVSPA